MIRVLVVEDSPVVREFLVHILSSDPAIRVVGTAGNGEAALAAVKKHKPDVISMDIHMPKMDGFEATRRIMETEPTPIVIVSGSWDTEEVASTFRAVEAGALAAVPRPKGIGHPEHERSALDFVQTVKLMSEVKVVRRWARPRSDSRNRPVPEVRVQKPTAEVQLVAIGASTGGPMALQTIFSDLESGFPAPLLVVQHMSPGFVQGFVDWLHQATGFSVQVASHGDRLVPGRAYIAPDGFHMGVNERDCVTLLRDEPVNGLCPSVSYLFRSVANVYGRNAAGVLLTGMGKDGASDLKLMKEKGAVTIVQDEKSSVVAGMPGEAIRIGAATYVLPPQKIAAALTSLANKK